MGRAKEDGKILHISLPFTKVHIDDLPPCKSVHVVAEAECFPGRVSPKLPSCL